MKSQFIIGFFFGFVLFCFNKVLRAFDRFLSELLVSVAQQQQTSQINQCLFVALRGGLRLFGSYLDGSCKEDKALQSLSLISFSVFALKRCSAVPPDLVQYKWTRTIIVSNLANFIFCCRLRFFMSALALK